jgi:Protein of unknown function (DUF2867)
MDRGISMRLPIAAHESLPWRIRELAPDFTVEDVWALPVHGRAEDFPALLELLFSLDPANAGSLPARLLWDLRDRLGRWFGLGRTSAPADDTGLPIPGTTETSLADRLPDDLRDTVAGLGSGRLPFEPLYRTDDEYATEMSNRTVHGVMHLGWVPDGTGGYRGQMAVLVKPNGLLGAGYMAAIRPFRHLIVYPALLREVRERWDRAAATVT